MYYFYTKHFNFKTMCKYIPLKIPIGSVTPYKVQLYTRLKPTQYAWVENASGESMPDVTIIRERENGCVVSLTINLAGSGGITDETVYLNISK